MKGKVFRYGEFVIVLKDGIATVYDSKTKMKVFKGEVEQVINELHEKVEGPFSLDFDFEFNLNDKKRRGVWNWEF